MDYEFYLERREAIRQSLKDAVNASKDVMPFVKAYNAYEAIRCNWNERVREITSQHTFDKKVDAFLKEEHRYMTAWMRLMREYHKLTGYYLLDDSDDMAICWAVNMELSEYVGK